VIVGLYKVPETFVHFTTDCNSSSLKFLQLQVLIWPLCSPLLLAPSLYETAIFYCSSA